MAKKKVFVVAVKPQHPTGVYRRAGIEFTRVPQVLEVLPDAIKKDPWLVVTVSEQEKSKPDQEGEK